MNAERKELRALVREHSGNRSAIARALSEAGKTITRSGVGAKLRRLGLVEEADRLAAAAHIPGPRNNVPAGELKRERQQILDALASVDTYAEAPAKLGIAIATMYRKIDRHGITPHQVAARRKKLAAAAAAE